MEKVDKKTNNKGYYSKQLAALRKQSVSFPKSKGIRKDNKLSSKQSREKKKEYITSLEKLVKDQQNEIQILKMKSLQGNFYQNPTFKQQASYFDKLTNYMTDEIVEQTNSINEKLLIFYGKQTCNRSKLTGEFFMKMLKQNIPLYLRQFFDICESEQSFLQKMQNGRKGCSEGQQFTILDRQLVQKLIEKNRDLKKNYNNIFQNFHSQYQQLQKLNNISQQLFTQLNQKASNHLKQKLLPLLINPKKDSEKAKQQIYPKNDWITLFDKQQPSSSQLFQQSQAKEMKGQMESYTFLQQKQIIIDPFFQIFQESYSNFL